MIDGGRDHLEEALERAILGVARTAGEIIASAHEGRRTRDGEMMLISVQIDEELWRELQKANQEWAKATNDLLKSMATPVESK